MGSIVPVHSRASATLTEICTKTKDLGSGTGYGKMFQIRIRPDHNPDKKKRLEPGGRARIQAEVPQPAEQTHPQLVEAAHLAVAGQVRQDLRLSNDRNCSNIKELWKIRDRKDIKGIVSRDGFF
jgi:hypothetical protein